MSDKESNNPPGEISQQGSISGELTMTDKKEGIDDSSESKPTGNPLKKAKLTHLKQIPSPQDILDGKITFIQEIYDEAKEKYNRMVESYTKLLQIQDLYSEPIETGTISPNPLNQKLILKDTKAVRLIRTATEDAIIQRIKECFEKQTPFIYLQGPIGIGKSHAVLAYVLQARKDSSSIIIYVNDPAFWIANPFPYIIREMIYSLIAFREEIASEGLLQPDFLPDDDPLFKWYYLMSYTCKVLVSTSGVERCLKAFFDRLGAATRLLTKGGQEIPLVWILDQENGLNKQKGSEFPFILRRDYCEKIILLASANNETSQIPDHFTFEQIYVRLADEEIRRLVVYSWGILDFEEKDFQLLFKACRGNPLEAANILLRSRWDKTTDFQKHLESYFQKEYSNINRRNRKFIDNNSHLWNELDFQTMLQYLDAEVDIEKSFARAFIEQRMNKQFMIINETTKYLESLFPAAAYTFHLNKSVDLNEEKINQILTHPQNFENATIGRFVEHHIINQLKKDINRNKYLKLRYTDFEGHGGVFDIFYKKIVTIPMGSFVPSQMYESSIIIPQDPDFPCVDAFYYDFDDHILYPMQITISIQRHKESHPEFERAYLGFWKKVLKRPGRVLKHRFLWIGGTWEIERLYKKSGYAASVTKQSWTIDYNQLPFELFNVSRLPPQIGQVFEPQDGPQTYHVPKLHIIFQLSSVKKQETFEKNCEEHVAKLERREDEIEVEYFTFLALDDNGNMQKMREGFLHFHEKRDFDELQAIKSFEAFAITEEDFKQRKEEIRQQKNVEEYFCIIEVTDSISKPEPTSK